MFDDIFGVVTLDEEAFRRVAKRKEATARAYLIVAVVAVWAAIMAAVFEYDALVKQFLELGVALPPLFEFTLWLIAIQVVVGLLSFWIIVLLYVGFARVFGGKGKVHEVFRVIGHLHAIAFLTALPLIGMFALVYNIIADIFALSTVMQFSKARATGAVLLSYGVLLLAAFLFLIAIVFFLVLAGMSMDFPAAGL